MSGLTTVMIMGGLDFLGSHLARFLSKKYGGYRIVIVDSYGTIGCPIDVNDCVVECVKDFNDELLHTLISTYRPEIIIDLSKAFTKSSLDLKSFHLFLDSLKIFGLRTLHLVPEQEHFSILDHHFPVLFKISNIYGPDHDDPINDMVCRAAVSDFVLIPDDGTVVRDWLYIDDCCSALSCLVDSGSHNKFYNIGSSEEIMDRDLAQMILGKYELPLSMIDYDESSLSGCSSRKFDIADIKRLGWAPTIGIDRGVSSVIRLYSRHNNGGQNA